MNKSAKHPDLLGTQAPVSNPKRRRWIIAILIVSNIIAIAIPLIMELTGGENAEDFRDIVLNMNYLLLALACFVVAIFADWARYSTIIKSICRKFYPKTALQISIIGRYYDNVTPSGAGGQPFQIYYLNKDGIPKGESATIPISAFSLNQFAFVIIALAVILCGFRLEGSLMMIAVYVGVLLYFGIPFIIILFSLLPGRLNGLLKGLCKLLAKFRLIKDPDEKYNSWSVTIQKYQSALKQMWQHKILLASSLAAAILYYVSILSIPYFVLKAFGANVSFIDVFTLNTLIYCAITIIPTPGNAGAAESLFYGLFRVVSPGYVFWATLIWRVFCYYGFILAGIVVFAFRAFGSRRKLPDVQDNA